MSVKNWLARITRFIISILIYKFHIFIAEYISFVHQDFKQRFFSLRYVQLKKKSFKLYDTCCKWKKRKCAFIKLQNIYCFMNNIIYHRMYVYLKKYIT